MKITILLMLILVLFSTSLLSGQSRYYSHQKLDSEYFTNGWNAVHLTGSMALNMALRVRCKMSPLKASTITFLAGAAWEFSDAVYASLRKGPSRMDDVFDPKGADWRDLVMDGAGIVCGNLICGVSFNHNKQPMASVTFKLN